MEGPADERPSPIVARGLRFAFPGAAEPTVDLPALGLGELAIRAGEHTAFVGPSGCGKTTLLRLFTGILRPTSGEIELAGRRLDRLGDASRRALRITAVGMVFQRFALLGYLTALQNILLPFRVNRALALDDAAREHARRLAEATGIALALARRPANLSQGEQQRVAICRALVTRPDLIVCDEPTGNLDPARAASVIELILRQADETGATVLLVTHDHAQLAHFARVIDLRGEPTP
ncbi:MAG: ABC transporter ATP-binding protein [Planctomycetota bacterium]